jgi:phosphohistidine phosphatase
MQPRRLLLVRHAPAAGAAVDADRPLTARGEERASAIGSWLAQAGLAPDLVLVSPARRAAQTWSLAGAALPADLRAAVDARIYENTVDGVLSAIRETPEDVRILAVVGHNPSVGELAVMLDDGEGDEAAGRTLDAGFPAGGVAVFTVPASFGELEPGGAALSDFVVPGE